MASLFLEGVYFVVMGTGTTSSYRWTSFVKKKKVCLKFGAFIILYRVTILTGMKFFL